MISSGIAPLDARLGGLVPGRTYVLTGAPGTGKTVACLEFLCAGLEAGEKGVLLSSDQRGDLVAQGRYLGIDLDRRIAGEQLVLLRYQLDFTRRFAHSALPDLAFDELRQLIGAAHPARIVVDSVAPFLEDTASSGAGIQSLVAFLDSLGATSMVTYPGDLAERHDGRLEPLAQHAGAILHFTNGGEGGEGGEAGGGDRWRMELRKVPFDVSSTDPIAFCIKRGVGIAGVPQAKRRRASDLSPDDARRILVVDAAGALPGDLLEGLGPTYDVTVRETLTSAFGDLASAHGAVLIAVRRDTVDDALTLVRELRRAGGSSPIALVSRFTLRAEDRARALRAGADEFLTGDLHPDEFIARLDAIIERGHAGGEPAEAEAPFMTQPVAEDEGHELLDAHAFRNAVNAHMAADRAPFFTLVTLQPQPTRDREASLELGEVVLRRLRLESGDLAGVLEGTVAVYLHSARQNDVRPFVDRVRKAWRRAGQGDIEFAAATYPLEEDRLIALLTAEPDVPRMGER